MKGRRDKKGAVSTGSSDKQEIGFSFRAFVEFLSRRMYRLGRKICAYITKIERLDRQSERE